MYLGKFKTDFSGKNRLVLPKKYRKELGNEDRFYILLGPNGEIWGFDVSNWQKIVENVLNLPLFTKDGRDSRRTFFSNADECVLDSQGRFVLPIEFVSSAKLAGEILLIGAGDHFEIWNPNIWDQVTKEIEKI
jgi:MraZ protein